MGRASKVPFDVNMTAEVRAFLDDLDKFTQQQRKPLTADTTYHVSTTGSDDTGTGSSQKPFASLDRANAFLAANIDGAGFRVFIQLADGTYTSTYPNQIANVYQFIIQGNTSDATKVIIQDDGYAGVDTNQGGPMVFQLRWLTIQQVNGGDPIIMDGFAASLQVANCIIDGGTHAPTGIFLQAQQDILAFGFDYDGSQAPNTIKGNYGSFFGAHSTGNITHGGATTISGTPAFSNRFIDLDNLSIYNEVGTYVNAASATGSRYSVSANSVFNSNGQGIAYLPGNAVGATATGGQYI